MLIACLHPAGIAGLMRFFELPWGLLGQSILARKSPRKHRAALYSLRFHSVTRWMADLKLDLYRRGQSQTMLFSSKILDTPFP